MVCPKCAGMHRELTLRRGDVVYLRRAVDQNWFEGEHHGLVGRFPASYVEVRLRHLTDRLTLLDHSLLFASLVQTVSVKSTAAVKLFNY